MRYSTAGPLQLYSSTTGLQVYRSSVQLYSSTGSSQLLQLLQLLVHQLTSKIIHDWLPVMHMQGHITGNRQCPACAHPDETLDHLLQCPHPSLTRIRTEALNTALKKGQKLGMQRDVLAALCHLLQEYFTGAVYEPTNDIISEVVSAQRAIGLQYLPRGILTIHWRHVLDSLNCDNSDRKIASFIYIMWTEIVDKVWKARNDIVHRSNNLNRQADESRIDRDLRWYGNHYQDVLARQDFKLVITILTTCM